MTDQIPPRPEMKAGTPDLFSIDTMTAIKMGTRNLKKYMYEIQEAGKKLDLVVKVEKTNGGLVLWWYPSEMEAEIIKVSEEVARFDMNEVGEFTDNSVAYLGDDGEPESDGSFLDDYDVDLIKQRTTELPDETLADDSTAPPI